jgi:predicted chitinase
MTAVVTIVLRFGTRNNGELKTEARRNKFLMQQSLRESGIRSIRQKLCYSTEEVVAFYDSLPRSNEGGKCVIKPNMSAGTDR